jgi:hypothetical protein
MTEGRTILADYVRAGWFLVPIPLGVKKPVTARWNTREMCISDPEVAEWLDGNVGLAHAYSGTCAFDLDDLAKAAQWLDQRGIDLSALLEAPDAVRIESRAGRSKLLYKVAKPLPSFNLGKEAGLELRCATSGQLTVQDVLPPSIHPDTGKPYTWAYGSVEAHWSRLPPLPPQLLALWAGLIAPTAPKVAKPPKGGIEASRLRELLVDHDPNLSYPEWLKVGMALHHETGGSHVGLGLWNEWSAPGEKYKGLGDLEQHWRSFRVDHDNPITLASLRTQTAASVSEFDDETGATPTQRLAPAGLRAAMRATPASEVSARDRALSAYRTARRSKVGTIESRISNIVAVLGVPEIAGYDLSLDEFQDAIMISRVGGQEWRPLTDTDYTHLRVWLETGGNCEPIPHEMVRQAVHLVSERHKMDTAQVWLEGLKWDGVERIDTFCPRYFGTLDTSYERAVSAYLWTALAGRVMTPGCQADMVPVLIGRQGVGKSRGVQAMVPAVEHYVEVRLDEPDDAIARKCRGVLVGELAEMRGLKAADVERVKAFITRSHEKWVPKYKEFATNYPRRFLIIGTTNDQEFLPTDDEHRRWLPMQVDRVDVAAIRNDRDQLWAEALARWTVDGIAWQGMDPLAKPAREAAAGNDNWEEMICTWIDSQPSPMRLRLAEVMSDAVGLDPRHTTRSHELRVARVLRGLGYERRVVRDGARVAKLWVYSENA